MKKRVYYNQVEEVFVPVASPSEAKGVYRVNDREGKLVLANRANQISRAGSLNWYELPDAKPLLNELESELFGMADKGSVKQEWVGMFPAVRLVNKRVETCSDSK